MVGELEIMVTLVASLMPYCSRMRTTAFLAIFSTSPVERQSIILKSTTIDLTSASHMPSLYTRLRRLSVWLPNMAINDMSPLRLKIKPGRLDRLIKSWTLALSWIM
jgi:hypothetical protein